MGGIRDEALLLGDQLADAIKQSIVGVYERHDLIRKTPVVNRAGLFCRLCIQLVCKVFNREKRLPQDPRDEPNQQRQ